MRRIRVLSLIIVIVVVVAVLAVPAVLAKGNPQLLEQKLGFKGGSLIATGIAAGLANEAYQVALQGTGFAEATCVNPGGSQEVPGRNSIFVEAEDADTLTTDSSGSTSFTLVVEDPTTADVPPSPSPKEAGCPNGQWTVFLGPVTWTEGCVFLYDATGTELFDQACQAGPF